MFLRAPIVVASRSRQWQHPASGVSHALAAKLHTQLHLLHGAGCRPQELRKHRPVTCQAVALLQEYNYPVFIAKKQLPSTDREDRSMKRQMENRI